MNILKKSWTRLVPIVIALGVCFLVPRLWCGRHANSWFDGELRRTRLLANDLIAFEQLGDANRKNGPQSSNRFSGEWVMVTHQMVALGLAQICLSHPELKSQYVFSITQAAIKSFLPETRSFGTRGWQGEDALLSVDGPNGHAYLAYSAMAVGMARSLDPSFPPDIANKHDTLIAAFERRLLSSPTGLIETYPGETYPTDVAAVAAAIALHGRATASDHKEVLEHWVNKVREFQIDPDSGLLFQSVDLKTGRAIDSPRSSGTGLAAYYAGFVDRPLALDLTQAILKHEITFLGFGGIREYASGYEGQGDVDSGPVILGVSVSATGFALAPLRAHGHRGAFTRLFRTAEMFGIWHVDEERGRFATGGPIGNALLLAMLTSGPEVAP